MDNYDDKFVEVHFEEVEGKYYTIEQVSEILELDQAVVIFYCNKLRDYLNITQVDMFHIFNDIDIENLKRIKHLNIDKNMDMEAVEKYLLSHQQEIIIKKDENKAIDKSFLNFIGQVLSSQNEVLVSQNKKIDKVLENNDKMINIIEKLYTNQEQITQTLNSISNEVAVTKDTNEKIDKLRESMEHRKEETDKEQKKSIFSIFKKK